MSNEVTNNGIRFLTYTLGKAGIEVNDNDVEAMRFIFNTNKEISVNDAGNNLSRYFGGYYKDKFTDEASEALQDALNYMAATDGNNKISLAEVYDQDYSERIEEESEHTAKEVNEADAQTPTDTKDGAKPVEDVTTVSEENSAVETSGETPAEKEIKYDNLTGRQYIIETLKKYGVELSEDDLNNMLEELKEIANGDSTITTDELNADYKTEEEAPEVVAPESNKPAGTSQEPLSIALDSGGKKELYYDEDGNPKIKLYNSLGNLVYERNIYKYERAQFNELGANIPEPEPEKTDEAGGTEGQDSGKDDDKKTTVSDIGLEYCGLGGDDCYVGKEDGKETYYTKVQGKTLMSSKYGGYVANGCMYVNNPNWDKNDPNSKQYLQIGKVTVDEKGNVTGYYINNNSYADFLAAYNEKNGKSIPIKTADGTTISGKEDLYIPQEVDPEDKTESTTLSSSKITSSLKRDGDAGSHGFSRENSDNEKEYYTGMSKREFNNWVSIDAKVGDDGFIYIDNPNYNKDDPNGETQRIQIGVVEKDDKGNIKTYYINNEQYKEYINAYTEKRKAYYEEQNNKWVLQQIEYFLANENGLYDDLCGKFTQDYLKILKNGYL